MKKLTAIVLALCMVLALCACGSSAPATDSAAASASSTSASSTASESASEIKVGLITLHDENSGYDKNFIDAFEAACAQTGVTPVYKKNVAEDQACYDAAADLADAGCSIVISDSYNHQSYMLQAANDFPEVQFVSCTGDTASLDGVANFHNAFAAIFEGRYLAGVAAGLKLNEMLESGEITEAKMGYVGAVTYAEIISGMTSFYLGAKSVCPSVTMDVLFTGTWLDEALENEYANALIERGCVLISQHADSMGAPNACEAAGVPNVAYNVSTAEACPNTYIIASRIDWSACFATLFESIKNGETIPTDITGNLATGMVALTEINESVAAEGTAAKLEEVKAGIIDGSVQPFDSASFTVNGEAVPSFLAIDTDGDWVGDTEEAVFDGAFHESYFRSAPYFSLTIDGINVVE